MKGLLFCSFLCLSIGFGDFRASASDKIAPSPNTLLDEIADSQEIIPVSQEVLISSIAQGNLISVGETHASGLERNYLSQFYGALAASGKIHPTKCLVENYEVLLSPMDDPVRPEFNKICPTEKVLNHVERNDYSQDLKDNLKHGTVVTHTGGRHIVPFGLIYPKDFDFKQWVDIPPRGTITKQLPSNFGKSKTMNSLAMFDVNSLVFEYIKHRSKEYLAQNMSLNAAFVHTRANLLRILQGPGFRFLPNENFKSYEVLRIHENFKFEKSYVTVVSDKRFDVQGLVDALAKPEMTSFLNQVDSRDLTAGVFLPAVINESFSIGPFPVTEPGVIYFYGPSLANTKATIALIFSPSKGPQIFIIPVAYNLIIQSL